MKYFYILIIFVCQIYFSFGQDYLCPNEVDFGEMIVSNRSDTNIKYDNFYYMNFKVISISNSQSFYQNQKLDILYDSLIYAKGNRISFLGMSANTFYKDTLIFKFMIATRYFEGIDKINHSLDADFTFFYLKKGSHELDSQKVRIKFTIALKNKLFINTIIYNNYEIRGKNRYGINGTESFYQSILTNLTNQDFIIDSIGQKIVGKNFFSYSILPENPIFPDTLKAKDQLIFLHKFKYFQKEHAISLVNFYGHFDNFEKKIIISDTNDVIFDYYDDFYVNLPLTQYYLSIYETDTFRIKSIRFDNYTDSTVNFKSFNLSSPDNLTYFFSNNNKIPPFDINSYSRDYLKDIYVFSDILGKHKLMIKLNFKNQDGTTFSNELEYIVNVIEKHTTSVENDFYKFNYSVHPNPATDYIEISTSAVIPAQAGISTDIKIYDVLGVCVLSQGDSRFRGNDRQVSDEGLIRIDVSGLAAGVYFVRVGDKMLKFVKI